LEASFLLLVCLAVFFPGLDRFDFIKTEGLRAIVVKEMLETPGISMPSVHHRPQLKKPPLYAWTTAVLARGSGYDSQSIDEGLARLPSAIAASLLVLLLYGVAEVAIWRSSGLITAAFALACVTIQDYGMRAELDMGFAFATSLSILLAYAALGRPALRSIVCWMGCYFFATAAALWKGPHSLIFLWVLLLCWSWRKKRWKWLMAPGQVAGLLLCLGVLVTWTIVLSSHAGGREVGKTAVIELISRLVPLSVSSLLSILYAVPEMVIICLPASLFLLASLRPGVLVDRGIWNAELEGRWQQLRRWLGEWWDELATHPFMEFCLFWLVANFAWSIFVPAKAPRYWIPMFPPLFFIAGYLLQRAAACRLSAEGVRLFERSWKLVFGVAGAIGAAALVAGVIGLVSPNLGVATFRIGPGWAWLMMGVGWLAMGLLEWSRRLSATATGRAVALIVLVLASRPLVAEVVWPARAAADSQRSDAVAIDAIVPEGEPVLVLGSKEIPDTAFYSERPFYWVDSPADGSRFTSAQTVYCLLRVDELAGSLTELDFAYTSRLTFERADHSITLVEVALKHAPGTGGQP
jgi:4-amino-4-deoxy-L-arabinose transferase-like glycosyltransferase